VRRSGRFLRGESQLSYRRALVTVVILHGSVVREGSNQAALGGDEWTHRQLAGGIRLVAAAAAALRGEGAAAAAVRRRR